MEKLAQWITSTFKHPLSPMFFFLGVILVLLGVSNGFSLPVLNQLASDVNFRWACLALGIACFTTSIFIYYRPPKGSEEIALKSSGIIGTVPEELTMTYSGRRAALSYRQGEILTYLISHGYNGELITQDVIHQAFDKYDDNELLYRLEHLRLLGFLLRQKIGKDSDGNEKSAYLLSPHYIKEIGNKDLFARVSSTQQINVGDNAVIHDVSQTTRRVVAPGGPVKQSHPRSRG